MCITFGDSEQFGDESFVGVVKIKEWSIFIDISVVNIHGYNVN